MSAYHGWVLGSLPESERFLLQHVWRLVRFGQLDANFDLALDPLSSTMTLVATGIGLPIFVFAASSMKDRGSPAAYARFFAWLNALVFAMLLLVLADNFLLLLFGWEGVGLCSWGLVAFAWTDGASVRAGGKAFVVGRVSDALLVLGIALFYWVFGGGWAEGDYVPDLNARFSSVEVQAPGADSDDDAMAKAKDASSRAEVAAPAERDDEDAELARLPTLKGEGLLTLTSYPGATVFMDDARTPMKGADGQRLRAPFARLPVRAGYHSFRIHPGGGLDDFLVTHVAFGEGRGIALSSFGPTVTFREARDQLALRDAHGAATVHDSLLAKRGFGSVGLVTVASLLLFFGAAGKSAQIPLHVWLPDATAAPAPASALLQTATVAVAGVYLVARLGFFFALSPAACTVVALVGAATALSAAVAALYQYDIMRILAYSTVSQLGMAMLGVGASGYAAGVFQLVAQACCKACLILSAGALVHALPLAAQDEALARDVRRMGGLCRLLPRTARAYAVGCIAMTAAPIPGLAGFWSTNALLVRAFSARTLFVPGALLGGVALVVTALTSFYTWRTYYLAFDGESRASLDGVREAEGAVPRVLAVLLGLCALVGVLGVSSRLLGRGGDSWLEEWLAPSLRGSASLSATGGALREWGVIVAAYACSVGGFLLARAHYSARQREDHWEARERRAPLFAAGRHGFWADAIYANTLVALFVRTRHFAAEFDRYVIDGIVHATGILTRALAWLVGRVDDDVVNGAVRALSHGTVRAGERVRSVQTGRAQTYVYVIVLGILALALLQYWLR